MTASWPVHPWFGSPGIKIAHNQYKNCSINKKINMSIVKKHIVPAEDGVDAHSTLCLISRKAGYKVTALLKKQEPISL
jgi:hypothetical protein